MDSPALLGPQLSAGGAEPREVRARLAARTDNLDDAILVGNEVGALNFVMRRALGGGVTRSLALDTHGKCLGSAILDMEIPAS